ncbi:MAG: TonB-dependent receptor [Novosphingobium sp.]
MAAAAGRANADEPKGPEAASAALQPNTIIVTASTTDLLGKAQTSSQGSITRLEVEQRPIYRTGQLLETVPGLTVTAHSGEGKANQYLLRGFNLDHGTDLATYVDGMPVNQRTHAHGQGYTDLNFLLPELIGGIDFGKGPYFASEGDFAAVGNDHMHLVNRLRPMMSVGIGTVHDQRVFAGGSVPLGGQSDLLAAGEFFHLDGPWDNPDNYRRYNGALRWSSGSDEDGTSITAMGYSGHWNATTDQPLRAIRQGLIGRFGSLDPSDGGRSFRYSLSARLARQTGDWGLHANAYTIRQIMTLWNNFTHYLNDPVHGDQQAQNDHRWILGGSVSAQRPVRLAGIDNTVRFGVQGRYDTIRVDLSHTERRQLLDVVRDDQVDEGSVAAYLAVETHWTSYLRTTVGVRDDYFHVSNDNHVGGLTGNEHANLFQPKINIALRPWAKTEFYVSAGRGFHSNDGRAGLVTANDGTTSYRRPPLLVSADSYEVGVRTNVVPHLTAAVTGFLIDFQSELTYNADAGQTEAGRPSRRYGIEFTGQYRPVHWLEINANLATSHARYRDRSTEGSYIEDAPIFVGSAGILVNNLGHWSGAAVWRKLGPHPLVSDNSQRSAGYSEINANIGYRITPHLKVQVDVYNLTNSHQHAADYYYTTRLPGEPAEGVNDMQIHPLEPRSARVTLTAAL